MADLSGKVCVVTGASRGVGKGIALGLVEAGATVHITGRTVAEGDHPLGMPGSLESVASEAADYPGRLIAHRVDHAHDAETEAILREVIAAEERLDVLVNNAWPGYERMVENNQFTWMSPLWEQPMWRWDEMIGVGVRAAYCGTRIAAEQMAAQRSGLIVNISFWAAQKFLQNVVYGIAKAAADKMSADVAEQLREYGVAAVSLYPGLVRTELVMRDAAYFDLSNSESPLFVGRAVAALAGAADLMELSGKALVAAALAERYGFTDVDGSRPRPLTLDSV
ncbi:SDR family NAD(P)-dependent oxidoreductase [Streptosporangiaceae bacterium NEAU-GS5]|nr:SDR family NAD(P)-dependent oxidoreductase [Streptosporangiaceae bacterium NEAU-GS5]